VHGYDGAKIESDVAKKHGASQLNERSFYSLNLDRGAERAAEARSGGLEGTSADFDV
jgi:hypothetical protein